MAANLGHGVKYVLFHSVYIIMSMKYYVYCMWLALVRREHQHVDLWLKGKEASLFVRTSYAFHAFTSSAHWRYELLIKSIRSKQLKRVVQQYISITNLNKRLFESSSHWLDSGDVWHFKILLFVESVPVTGRQNNWTGALNGFSIWLDWAGMCLFHPIPLQIHCTY